MNLVWSRVRGALLVLLGCRGWRNGGGRRGLGHERLDASGRVAAQELEHSRVAAREQMSEQMEAGLHAAESTAVRSRNSCTAAVADERLVLLVERENWCEFTQWGRHALPVRWQTGGEREQFALNVMALQGKIKLTFYEFNINSLISEMDEKLRVRS